MIVFSNKIKTCSARFVAIISFVISVLALVLMITGGIVSGYIDLSQYGTPLMEKQTKLGIGVIIMGFFILVIGIFGCLTCKFKKPYFAVPFIVATGVLGLIILVVGALMTGHDELIEKARGSLCGENSKMDIQYNRAVSNFVCSEACKCPLGEGGKNKKLWESYDETFFNKWGRTKSNTAKAGYDMLYWAAEGEDSYETWIKCYDEEIIPLKAPGVPR